MSETQDFERRLRRSNDPVTALHYQLAHARHAAGLEAMVLVDETGMLVAGAGAWPVCEELAAFAPLLAHDEAQRSAEAADATDRMRGGVALRALWHAGTEVFLAARGPTGAALEKSIARAAAGCMRILGLEAAPPAFGLAEGPTYVAVGERAPGAETGGAGGPGEPPPVAAGHPELAVRCRNDKPWGMGLWAYRSALLVLPLLLGCSNIAGLSSLQEVDTCVGEGCPAAGVGGAGAGGAPGAGGMAGVGGAGGGAGKGGAGGGSGAGAAGKGGAAGSSGTGGKAGAAGSSGTGGTAGAAGKAGAGGAAGKAGAAGVGAAGGAAGKGGAGGVSGAGAAAGAGAAGAAAGTAGASGAGIAGAAGNGGAGGCTPSITCAGIGKNCGMLDDGCGTALDCGTCQAPNMCGMNVPNVCGCLAGQVFCGSDGSVLERCAADGASIEGLGICASPAACSVEMGKCTGCTPGETLCEGNQPVKCNADGMSTTPQGAACGGSTICSPTAPAGCAECVAGRYFCLQGSPTLKHCAPDGSSSAHVADCSSILICQHSVIGGLDHCLTPVCTPGQTRCLEDKAQVCNANQDGWDLVQMCASAALCQNGACMPSQCAVGETKCYDTTQMQTCKDDQTGFAPPVQCHAPTPSCDTVGGVGACSVRGPAMVPITSDDVSKTLYYIDSTEVTDAQYNVFLASKVIPQSVSKLPAYCSWNADYGMPEMMPTGRPTVGVDWCDAFAYCQWAQKRLCGKAGPGDAPVDISNAQNSTDIENDEWFRACEAGPMKLAYPYSQSYLPTACNGLDKQIGSPVVAGSDSSCEGGYAGIFDMSGNVSEWENGCSANLGANDICNVRGGNYSSVQADLGCGSVHTVSRNFLNTKVIGIRCCADP